LTNNNNNNNVLTYDIESNYFSHEDNSINNNNNSNNNFSDGPSWICSVCTFQNHPLLDKCEQCEMPNINLTTSVTTTSGGTTGISENNYYNNTRSPQVNNASNNIQITASDFVPRRLDNQYQMSSSCDSLSNNNNINNNNNNTSVPATHPSYLPPFLQNVNKFMNPFGNNCDNTNPYTIGSQLTNAILLPATVVTPSLLSAGNSPQPTATLIPTSGNYKTHRHTPSM
jgi:hypothetical protein